MRPLQIFISHSSHTKKAKRFCDSIFSALEADEQFKPLLDRNGLKDGGNWRQTLFDWMRAAHGAVLLVSEATLKSNFVPIEASVFAFRRSFHKGFPILPVLIDGVTPKDLKKGILGGLALNEISFITPKDPADAAQRVLAALKAELQDHSIARTPRELREEEIVKHLRDSHLSESDLDSITSLHGWEEWNSSVDDLSQAFAATLLQVDYSFACAALRHLISRNHSSSAALLAILGIVTPFWVKEEDAIPITTVAIADQSCRLLAIDAHYTDTPHAYICRAYVRPYSDTWWAVSVQPPDQEDSMGSLRSQIISALLPSKGGRMAQHLERLLFQLAERERDGGPTFAIFPRNWRLDPGFLDNLRREFPTLTILALAEPGAQRFQDLVSPGEERESKAWGTYDQTLHELEAWRRYA